MKSITEEPGRGKLSEVFDKMLINLVYTNNWIHDRHVEILKTYNITPQQYNILKILREQFPNPATVTGLMESMINKMCDASRLVEKLRVKNLVERVTCPNDRRSVNVAITEMGIRLLNEIDPEMDKLLSEISLQISAGDAEKLDQILNKIRSGETKEII